MRKSTHSTSLKFQHGVDQREYLAWKVAELEPLFLDQPVKEDSYFHPKQNKTYPYVWALSYAHPVLSDYKCLFYSRPDEECIPPIHKKRITPEILDMVDDLALAVWYMDDGSYHQKFRYVRLYVGAVSEAEYQLVFDWVASMGVSPRFDVGTNSRAIRLRQQDSKTFISRIRPHVPSCMSYKLGDRVS